LLTIRQPSQPQLPCRGFAPVRDSCGQRTGHRGASGEETKKGGEEMNSLAAELKLYGVQFDPDKFNQLLVEIRVAMAPTMSIEDFVCHLDDAKQFCNAVRSRIGGPLPDWVICRRLLNLRKKQGKKGKK
jgi:hypothetical protein